MKKASIIFIALILAGCSTVKTTEVLSDKGTVIKRIRTEEGPFGKLMKEMSKKDIAWWRCGWWFRCEITFTGSETYMPVISFSGGKANRGHISLTKDSKQNMAECIRAMQQPMELTVDQAGIGIKEK